jgi:hypothetical protein
VSSSLSMRVRVLFLIGETLARITAETENLPAKDSWRCSDQNLVCQIARRGGGVVSTEIV